MTKFIFVRHGQSQTNIEQHFTGQLDSQLTEKGILQAELLSKWVEENYSVDKIYASDLSRAYNTALACANKFGISVLKCTELREINGGSWHGKKYVDIMEEYPEEYRAWKNNIGEAALPEGETVKDFSQRIVAEIKNIAGLHPNQTVMVVTHAVVIRAMMAVFQKGDIAKAAEIPWVPNASVTVANYENGRMQFEVIGFDGFLENIKTNIPGNLI